MIKRKDIVGGKRKRRKYMNQKRKAKKQEI